MLDCQFFDCLLLSSSREECPNELIEECILDVVEDATWIARNHQHSFHQPVNYWIACGVAGIPQP